MWRVLMLGLSLGGCAAVVAAPVILSDVAKASCGAQAALNAAGDVAMVTGHPNIAADLAKASAIAGVACVW